LLLAARLAFDAEVAAVTQCPKHRALMDAVVGREHRSWQVLRVGVDGEAEQNQLQHRNTDDHAEGEPVALELDELLQHDADPARQRRAAGVRGRAHWKLSSVPFMSSTNTVS